MPASLGVALAVIVFAAIVVCMVYMSDFEKDTGLPRRRPFYIFLLFLAIVVVALLALYEFGFITLGPS